MRRRYNSQNSVFISTEEMLPCNGNKYMSSWVIAQIFCACTNLILWRWGQVTSGNLTIPPDFLNFTWAWDFTHLYKSWSRACQCCVGWGLGPELDSCDLGPAAPSGSVTVVTGQCSDSSAPQSPLLPGMGHGFIVTTSSSADPGWCFKRRSAKNSQSRRRPLLY